MTDILKQIKLLESQDSKVSEDARHALSLQINLGNGVQNLVAYYAEHRSERALDLLCKIREPHDKILLDSLVETVKDKKALATLFLLGQIVQTAPSWTPKIAMHPLFKTVLSHISSCKRIVECIAGILFAALLLPHCSSLPAPVLQMLFSTFIECCKLYRMKWREIEKKNIKQNDEERVNTAHFGFAIREYFHTLYGIYPANFLCYLRNYFVDKGVSTDRKKCDLAKMVLYPLLNGVRFHPNLILMSKEKELSRDRWAQREAHDFLDDCRRVIIGKIPINANNDGLECSSEPDSPPVVPPNFFASLFPSNTSSNSSNFGWNDSWSEGGMLEALNTPPGSVVATPLQKRSTVDDGNVPIVITSEEKTRRRSTGGGSSRSFRLSISSVFKRNTESRRQPTLSTSEPLIEVLAAEVEERQKINENDQPDEAEEAMDCLTPVDGSRSPVRQRGDFDSDNMTSPNDSTANESTSVSTLKSPLEKKTSTCINSLETSFDTGITDSLRIVQAAEAARRAVREKTATMELDDSGVTRSRSTSFLFGGPAGDDKATADTAVDKEEPSEGGDQTMNESIDGGRSRFSLTSFFTKINRQRFVSECPILDDCEVEGLQTHVSQKALERTTSCPNFAGENRTPAQQIRDDVASKGRNHSHDKMLDKFPYLRLIRPLGPEHYAQIETQLEQDHEILRAAYMDKSKEFHLCLKELGLADRLPGRIYDDMGHITQGLPIEKQRDILRTRLELVNQHLLYERSCRLLHANRNRRLFGRIKQQKITDAELEQLKENLHDARKERTQLISALTDIRRSLDTQKRAHKARETEIIEAMKVMEMENAEWAARFVDQQARATMAEEEIKLWKAQVDSHRRRADDAEEQMRLMRQQMDSMRHYRVELVQAQADNQQLRDLISLNEAHREDDKQLRSPDADCKRVKQLEAELERMRLERERERTYREELRERYQDAEAAYKTECGRSSELKGMLDRASRLLREQNEAAEQKFLSLQAVTRKQEEHTLDLYRILEEKEDKLRHVSLEGPASGGPMAIPSSGIPCEIRSYESNMSDVPHSYFVRELLSEVNPYESSSQDDEINMDMDI